MKSIVIVCMAFFLATFSISSSAIKVKVNREPVFVEAQPLVLAGRYSTYRNKRNTKPYWCCRKYRNGQLVSTRRPKYGSDVPKHTSQGYQCTTIYNNAPCR